MRGRQAAWRGIALLVLLVPFALCGCSSKGSEDAVQVPQTTLNQGQAPPPADAKSLGPPPSNLPPPGGFKKGAAGGR